MSVDTITRLNSIQPKDFANDFERFEAKEATRGLLARLETPFERAWALVAEQPVFVAGLMLAKDLGIWSQWATFEKKNGPGAARQLTDILSMCNSEVESNLMRRFSLPVSPSLCVSTAMKGSEYKPVLTWPGVGRVLRHLAATFVIEEVDVDTWKPTPFSLGLGDEVGKMVQTRFGSPCD